MNQRDFRLGRVAALLTVLCLFLASGGELFAAAKVAPATPPPTNLTKEKPFGAVAAGPRQVSPGETVQLRYTIYILNRDHYVYKERTGLDLKPVDGVIFGPVQFSPEPEKKHDTFEDRDMEIYHDPVTLFVDATVAKDAAPGSRTVEAVLRYQGCNPTVCFFPAKTPLVLSFDVVKKSALAPAPGGTDEAGRVVSAESSGQEGAGAASGDGVSAVSGEERGADAAADPVMEAAGGDAASVAAVRSGTDGAAGEGDAITSALKHGLLWTFLVVFGLGIVASLTPCVYPIIPITISVLGARNAQSRLHGFSLALVYVLGLSVTYTALGMFAALTGSLFGSWMQSPYVIGGVAALFIAMGAGMLGAFNVAMPSGITTRLSQIQGRGYPGAFLTGAVAGLVASPCVGPLIVSLLTYIAQTKDVALGAALMFTFAFGMGQLFLALGTFTLALPKSGAWMDSVKGGLALVLFGVGLYYLRTVIPSGYYELILGLAAVAAGVYVGAFHALTEESGHGPKLRKIAGIAMLVVGMYSLVGGLFVTRLVAPGLPSALQSEGMLDRSAASSSPGGAIRWNSDYETSMARARETGAPVLLDFTADWCGACKELEHQTYTDARVISAAQEYVAIKLDVTRSTPESEALQAKYGVKGLPSVLFLNSNGEPNTHLTVTGFVPPEEFLSRLCQVQGPQASRLTHVCRG